ncbi:MAG: thioredoxin family protein [Synergistales bacterium]|nr:thioredoxin family protein [Synergistales bacterium]
MKVQVIGRICPDVDKVLEMTKTTLADLGLKFDIERVTETEDIIHKFGMVHIPALAVDGKVIFAGHVPTVEKLRKTLSHFKA